MKPLTLILTILVLGSLSSASALAAGKTSPEEQQFALAGQPAVKIVVRDSGWYGVSRKQLLGGGLSASAATSSLHLYTDGAEVPILVRGARHGRLTAAGSIEFYGRGRNVRSTDARTYWLVVESKPGARIPVVNTPRGLGKSKARSYTFTSIHRDRLYYAGWASQDRTHFFGKPVNPSTGAVDQTLVAQDLDLRSDQARLRVAIHGVTTKAHKIKLTLNGTELSTISFEGQVENVTNLSVPRKLIKEGSNVLNLNPVAGELDFNIVDELGLTYSRLLRAHGDFLNFTVPEGRRASVTGFTKPNIRVFDISNPDRPRALRAVVTRGDGGYALKIGSDGQYHRYLALNADSVRHVSSVGAERPSAWHDDSHGADMLIISHRDFVPSLKPLKELHERQGLKVAVADVQDVYDEFNYGTRGPEAIRTFVMWTRTHWHPAPRFLLLVGDSTYDPRNYLGKGQFDFLPTKFITTPYMETATDGWFGDANNDGIPELAIGRLPVRTKNQADTVVSKIVRYEDAGPPAPTNNAFLVADSDGKVDFNGPTERVRSLFPSSVSVDTARRSDGPNDAALRRRIIDRLNQGPAIVNYFGHGAVNLWSAGGLFGSADAEHLQNGANLSLYVMMSCLNGYWVAPTGTSLAEALLEAKDGGAVAVVSASGLSDAAPQPTLNQEFFRILFSNPQLTIGQVLNESKKVITDQELRQTQLVIGDPATHIRY